MCNVINRKVAFAVLLSALVAGCGIKYATNKVLSNPDAIAKVGAVYDKLNPRDTTEKLFFIAGDSIFSVTHDTAIIKDHIFSRDTIRITTTKRIVSTDTIIRTLPPDNRALARINDSLALYKALAANMQGNAAATSKHLKTAETRLIWMAGILLLAGVVIGVLIRFKLKP
jgi:hypothetical protein